MFRLRITCRKECEYGHSFSYTWYSNTCEMCGCSSAKHTPAGNADPYDMGMWLCFLCGEDYIAMWEERWEEYYRGSA